VGERGGTGSAGRQILTLHQVVVGCDLLRSLTALDNLEESVEDALSVRANVGLTEPESETKVSERKLRRGRHDAQEGSLLLDEENAFNGDGGVGVDDEGGVLEVRSEEGKDREELLLGQLRGRRMGQLCAHVPTRKYAPGCGRCRGT
jgi:hypothetical protein